MIFFSIWVFFHQHSWITGLQGKREGISLTPYYHFHSLYRHLTMIRVVILNIYVNHQSYLKQFLNPSWKLFSLMKSLTMCNNQTSIYIYIPKYSKNLQVTCGKTISWRCDWNFMKQHLFTVSDGYLLAFERL